MNKIVRITAGHFSGTNEIYNDFWYCPECKYHSLMKGWKFCPICGIVIDWTMVDGIETGTFI